MSKTILQEQPFLSDQIKQTVKLAIELKLASLGHISLDGSKPVMSEAEGFKANTSKHKAMSYGRLKEREQVLSAEIDDLIEKAKRCDQEEDKAYFSMVRAAHNFKKLPRPWLRD